MICIPLPESDLFVYFFSLSFKLSVLPSHLCFISQVHHVQ